MAEEQLTPDRIVAAALVIVDGDGWDALSMRRLAQDLDVWPMAMYRHFRDKQELTDAVVAAAAARVELPDDEEWRPRLRGLLLDARAALGSVERSHAGRALETDAGRRLTTVGRGALSEAGFDDESAERVWRALFGYSVGYPGFAGDPPGQFEFGLDRLLDGVLTPDPAL